MAGSYGHVDPETDGRWSLIENMGDAYECVEELLFLVRSHLDGNEIREALKAFYSYKTGRDDPRRLTGGGPEFESLPSMTDYGRAYLETEKVMEG